MTEIIHEYRGKLLENIHHGRIAVVNDQGRVLYAVGEPEALTFYRSASKPLQALPVLERHLEERYGLTDDEIVIMAGSHAGEDIHLNAILGMLDKAGFAEDELVMLPTLPANEEARRRMLCQNLPGRKALHNCAGKHSASMMLARFFGEEHRDYWKPDSAAQCCIAETIGEMADWPVRKTEFGIDGCGVPVFAVPLRCIAISFMRLACPDRVERPALRQAVEKLVPLIHTHPLMMRGTGYLCSVFNEDANVVAKGGAKGVYGFGLKKERLGISLKIEDGTEDSWPIIIAEILRQLDYDNPDTIRALERLAPTTLINDNGTAVGEIRPVFDLHIG